MAVVAPPVTAQAAGTLLFQNSFFNRTVDGTGTVTKPNPTSGTNQACLTASGNSATGPLLSCPSPPDAQGSGKLRLTNSGANLVGGIFGATSFPSSNGLDVTFNSYQWGGGGADGMGFFLAAVDPANSVPPTTIGPSGGSLGYSPAGSVSGLANAYLGVGLDVFGNFSSTGYQGSGCTNATNIVNSTPGAVVVRGPGNVRAGYCGLTTTYNGTTASKVNLRATARADSKVPVQVLINPTNSTFTSDSGVSVSAGTYKVTITPVGQAVRTLSGPLPAAPTNLYPSATWTNANGVPKQLAFGFAGSTGSVTDSHEIDSVRVLTFNSVPQLAVSTTSYSAATPAPGAPVNYVITPSVLVGADENNAISVTQATPSGVRPVGAFGSGWTCATPVGQNVTCTTTASSFADGTTLPVINVVGIVTASGMTTATVQNSSTTTVSSVDGNPGSDTVMSAGSVPPAPTFTSISPNIGPIAGGGTVTISGNSTTEPTAVEIGTTAEQQAGTPVVLLPCQGSATTGCFTITGTGIVIPSMPARSVAGAVTITVVTLGVAASTAYTYADKPVAIATPTATAGVTSASLTWVAPDDNDSAITSYIVTPWRNGVAQTPVSFDPSTTTRIFTGLTAGASYRYSVQAVNAYGTSTGSPQSVAVTPYALPAAPVISAVTAGTQQASLTWTAPANNGSPVTGYVVTPYIGAVAQTPRTFNSTATTQIVTGLTAGTAYTFTVAAQNAAGTGPASARSTAVTPNASPTLTFAAPPAGEVGAAYNTQLTVNNGTSPFAWSISTGSLPDGLTLSSSGLLSGTPTASGSFPVTVQVVDASGQTATRPVTLVIAAAPTVTFSPAAGEVTVPYSQQPTLAGGTGPFTWAITGGSLPAGLTIDATTGLISGTPTVSGSFSVTVSVTDDFDQVASRTVTIVIAALPVITSSAPAAGQVGLAYSTTFTVAGGSTPLVWSVSAGNVPSGLTLNTSTGVLSGTPTTTGSSSFTVVVTDAFGKTTTKAVTLVVNAGPIVITKTANKSSAAPGDTVVYTIALTNSSSTAFTGVNLSDPLTGVLDDAAYVGNASASTGSLTYTSSTLGWTGNVAAGATVTITYSVVVNNPDVGNKVLANTVTSSTVGTNCPSGSSSPLCTSTVTVAGLSIVHTASGPTTTPGSTVTFSIVVTNTGQTPYTGATVTENLTAMLDDATYTGATATSGSVAYTNPTLSWSGNLAVGASATITYTLAVSNPDPGNKSLAGTVVSSAAGSACPSGNPAASCTATVTVLVPALVISNTASVTTVTPGGQVPYTIKFSNTGQTAYTGTSVSIAMANALDDADYDNNFVLSSGSFTFNATTSVFTWTGDIPVGGVVTITGSLTVRNPDPANKSVVTVASSSAPGSTCPPGSANPACTSTVQVLVPALTISKSSSVTSTTPGSVVGYTVTATNTGQTPYSGATFSDDLADVLDDAVYGSNAVASSGTVSYTTNRVSWTGDLAVGASATITYSVTVNNSQTLGRSLTGKVTSTTPGNNCTSSSTDPRCTSTVAVLIPGLSISSVSDVATTTPGSVVRFTTTVTNTGQTTYTGTVITLGTAGVGDDADPNGDVVLSTGALGPFSADGDSNWTLSLAPGEIGTLSGTFTVRPTTTRGRSLDIRTTSDAPGSTCPSSSTNPSCSVSVPVLIPGLTITKTADAPTVVTGGTVAYTIVVRNSGETSYPAASFTDSLAAVLTDAVYSGNAAASTGTVSYANPTLSWTGALAPGATATITYSVVVRDPDPGDKQMTNTVVSTSAGSNCAGTSSDPRCTAVVNVLVPGLTIEKKAGVASTVPGGTVGFTIKVTNSGTAAQTGATVSDSLVGVLDDATYSGNATATAGTVSYAASTLTWTGDLAVGASTTISYSAVVTAASSGNNRLTNTVVSGSRGSNCAAGSADLRCTADVPVARLVLERIPAPPATTTPGSVINISTRYTNTGQVPYVGIAVDIPRADSSDDLFATGPDTVSSGTLVQTAETTRWTGNIPVGGFVTVTIIRTVRDPATGNRQIRAPLQSDAPGSNCPTVGATDPRCTFLTQVLIPGLTITKAASTSTVEPGGTVGYTTTISNSGQTPFAAASVTDSLAGLLDDAVYDGNAVASAGSVSYGAPTLTWTGGLAVGATVTITYSVTANNPDTGDKSMISRISSTDAGSSCLPGSTNAGCVSTVTVLTPGLTIETSADLAEATLGSTVTFTVLVRNTGQTSYPAASFAASLTDLLDDATYLPGATTASTGTVTVTNGVLSWAGGLSPGGSATITYEAQVNNPATGDRTMVNTVVSSTAGNNCSAGSTDPRCSIQVEVIDAVGLTFTKTADAASTAPGGVVAYTVRVANATKAAITGASFTDPLGGVLDDAAYNGSASATAGTVSYAAPNLSWTGTVPAQGSVTVTYTVTVKAADTGDDRLDNTVVSTTLPGSNNCAAGSSDPRCTTTVPVARLDLLQYAAQTTATPGSVIQLTAVYTNTGQVPYTGISVSSPRADTGDDTIPTGDQVASSGTLLRTATAITWTGDIAVGQTITITRTLTVKNPDPGNQIVRATLNSSAPGNNCQTGTTDPRCSFAVAVVTPKLTLTKSANVSSVVYGGTVSYTITVNNNGQTPYVGASFSDSLIGVLDDGSYPGNASATVGAVSYADSVLSWTGDLAVGQVATITYTVAVDRPDPGDKVMTNTVTSTDVGSTCPPSSSTPACRSTVVVLTPALAIVKTADESNANLGTTVTYTIRVSNTGQTSYPAATFSDALTDVLDDATYNAGATTTTSGTVSYGSGVLSWSGALAPGASATITYTATINTPSSGNRVMTNTVTSTTAGNNCAVTSTDSRCTALVSVTNAFALTFEKTSAVRSTIAGETVAYTVAVTNATGSAIAGVDFTDPLTAILDDATYNNDALASSGTVSFGGGNLTWGGTVAAGTTVTVTYSVTVRADAAGNEILSGQVLSTAFPASNNCLAASSDPRCTNTVTVSSLLLQQSYAAPTTTPGSTIRLTATFTNTGQTPYEGITIRSPSDRTLDDAFAVGDQTATSGTLVLSATAITWTGDIAVGATVTVTGTLVVKDPPTGNRIITGTLETAAPGSNCPVSGSDPRCTALTTVLLPGLTLTKSASSSTTVPGGTVGYTITIVNSGQSAYAAASVKDSLTGVLDDAAYNGDAVATAGALSYTSPTLGWTGDLAVGATVTITYTVTATDPGVGDKNMVNPVTSSEVGSTCPPASGNAGCVSSVDVLTPALTIEKSASVATVTLGSTVSYTVLVRNTGQTSYPAATFDDSLAAVLDDATYNPAATTATSGATSYAGGVLSWTGTLAPGAAATIGYTTTVDNPSTGDRTMTNTVTSSTVGSNCAVGSTDDRCSTEVSVTNAVALTFQKTADVQTTVPGGQVSYTVRVVNATDAAISGVNFTDSLSGVLDDAAYNGDAVASGGTVSYSTPNLSWTGTVPAQGSATVTYSTTVAAVGTGDELLTNSVSSTTLPASNNCSPGSTDPGCATTVGVARLLIAQNPDRATATPGELITASGTFTNTGQVPYTNISITLDTTNVTDDAIPEGDTASSGTFVRDAVGLTWTGDIPVGTTITTSRLLRVKNPDPGNKLVTATHRSTAPGNNCASTSTDPRCTFAVTVLIPQLSISTTTDVTSVVPNGVVSYTTSITNTGQTPYVAATLTDSLLGVLDDATYNGNAATTTGTVSFTSPNLTWTGDLGVGQVATITFTVTALRPAVGDKTMLNRVSSTAAGSTCLPNSANAGCTSTVSVRTPSLTTVVTTDKATAVPGDTVTYTVTATNDGQTDYTTATFNAPLGGLLDDAVYGNNATATTGTVVRTGNALDWTGALAQGAQAVITYSVTVKDPVPVTGLPGNHRLDQTITSIRNGSNCLAGSTDPRCSASVPIASLSIRSVADRATAKPTDVISYTGIFTNTGQVPYVGITVFINVLGSVDDVTYNGDAAATAGVVSIVPGQPEVSWTGDLAVGATVTFTSSVTVNNPDVGDKRATTVARTNAPGSNCPAVSSDPACSNLVTILTPALSITKVADRSTTTPGGPVNYTIVAANTGETAYTAAQVADSLVAVLDEAVYDGNATATVGTLAFTDQVLTWTGDLAPTESVTISYRLVVDNPDLGDKLLINRATSDELGSTCPTGGSGSACTSTVTVLVPALDIDIAADRTTTTPGSPVGYTLTIRNTGQTNYLGAQVNAALAGVLDDAAYTGPAASTSGSTTFAESVLTWTGDLAAGETATITYNVTANTPATGNKTLTTLVSSAVPGSGCSAGSPCVNEVRVLIPGLAVSTTADVATATPGALVTFTIDVDNTGETPYVGTTVTTPLGAILDDATLQGGATATTGVVGIASSTLTWTGSLAAGASATITYQVRVNDPDVGDRVLTTTVVDTDAGSTCPAVGASPTCTATVQVLVPALSMTKTADRATTTPGDVVRYTITLENTGQTAYTAATVTDSLTEVLPHADYNDDAVVIGGGVLSYGSPTLSWTGNLLVGASATITYSVTTDEVPEGDELLINQVTSTAPGSTCPPGSASPACSVTVRELTPALQISKTADRSVVVAGSPVTYTVTLTNTGETVYDPATFTDSLTGVLDDATYAGDASADTGTLEYTNNTLAWAGALAEGQTATITYSVTTKFPASGDQTLSNRVISTSAGASCPDGSTDEACRSEVTVLEPALSITKTADRSTVVAGGKVSYTIQATNTGESAYQAASLTDPLAGVLDDAVYDGNAAASSGAVAYTDGTLSWAGNLAVGENVLITYSITTSVGGTGDSSLFNKVSSNNAGSTCLESGSNQSCVSRVSVDPLVVGISNLTPSFTLTGLPGSTVEKEGAVGMTVTTNSPGGYSVTVQATDDVLIPTSSGNPDRIPVSRLLVRDSGRVPWTPLSSENPFVVHTKNTPSGPAGDAVSNDYRVEIPFVAADTYSTELEYIVATQ